MEMDLTHVRVLVSDYPACHRFYREVLGFKAVFGDENGVYEEFDAGNVMLAIFRREMMGAVVPSVPAGGKGADQVVLCLAVEDVDECFADLKGRGVRFETEPHDQPDWHIRVAHFRDPDGNLLEINAPLQKE